MALRVSLVHLVMMYSVLSAISGHREAREAAQESVTDPSEPSELHRNHGPWHSSDGGLWNDPKEVEKMANRMERKRHNHLKKKKERQKRRKERRKNRTYHLTFDSSQPSTSSLLFPGSFPSHPATENSRANPNSAFGPKEFPEHVEGFGSVTSSQSSVQEPNFDMQWLESNITSIWLNLKHVQREMKHFRRRLRASSHNRGLKGTPTPGLETSPEPCDPKWEVEPNSCIDEQGMICGWKGRCSCGQCICEPPNYGIHCRCNDMTCFRHDGVLCGGAGRGQCRCGECVCREEFTGSACECSTSTSDCRKGNGEICNAKGDCICNRCRCKDGYTGDYCDELIYSASICEKLKPCVLCKAYGKKYPQCEMCHIQVKNVEELESSRATCVMINSGCILKYAYIEPEAEEEAMTVLVKRERSC